MRGPVVCGSADGGHTVHVIDIIRIVHEILREPGLSVMEQDRIPFFCRIHSIKARTANGAERFKVVPVLIERHKAGLSAFIRKFINDLRCGDVRLRQGGRDVIDHYCDRTSGGNVFIDPKTGQRTACHSRMRIHRLGFGLGLRLRFNDCSLRLFGLILLAGSSSKKK